jgi:hypothetical protein
MDLLVDTHPRAHVFIRGNVLSLEAYTRQPTFRQPEFSRASSLRRAYRPREREARRRAKALCRGRRERIYE